MPCFFIFSPIFFLSSLILFSLPLMSLSSPSFHLSPLLLLLSLFPPLPPPPHLPFPFLRFSSFFQLNQCVLFFPLFAFLRMLLHSVQFAVFQCRFLSTMFQQSIFQQFQRFNDRYFHRAYVSTTIFVDEVDSSLRDTMLFAHNRFALPASLCLSYCLT
jgi:hypothetical protein